MMDNFKTIREVQFLYCTAIIECKFFIRPSIEDFPTKKYDLTNEYITESEMKGLIFFCGWKFLRFIPLKVSIYILRSQFLRLNLTTK